MRKLTLGISVVVVALAAMLSYSLAVAASRDSGTRSDCPGTIVCPLTGEEVCKDRCPLSIRGTDEARADCPGQVECPLSGELVCLDECPLVSDSEESGNEAETELPACCRGKK